MSVWKGISHARMTRSMHALRGGEYKVLAAIRRLIPDGERRKISQFDIATRAGVSEGTVSFAMKALDGPYIKRHYLGRGRGRGYEIEVLLPPEQRAVQPVSAPPKGSDSELSQRSFFSGITEPHTPPEKTSDYDPSLFLDHAHEQQQQPGGSSTQADKGDSGQAAQLSPETIAALTAAGAHVKLIQRVAAANPGCTPAAVSAALAAAASRPNAHTPPGLALECLASNQVVVPPRPRPEPSAGAGQRQRGREAPPTPEELRGQITRLGALVSPPERAAPPPRPPRQAGPDPALRRLWQAAQGQLRAQLALGEFDTWLRRLELVSLADGVATLTAPSAEIARAAEQRHGRTIRDALSTCAGGLLRVQVIHAAPAAT